MARQARVVSGTGIYHVMMRGINRQNIFEDEEDYTRFLELLLQMVCPVDDNGCPLPSRCTFYAYCLMSNHVHLVISSKIGLKASQSTTMATSSRFFSISTRILLLQALQRMLEVINGVAGENTNVQVMAFRLFVVRSLFWRECPLMNYVNW